MCAKGATTFRANEVGIEGHYEDQDTPHGLRRVWVSDELTVECSCGATMRTSEHLDLCKCGTSYAALVNEMKPILSENPVSPPPNDHEAKRLTKKVRHASEIAQALMQKILQPQTRGAVVTDSSSDVLKEGVCDSVSLDNEIEASFLLEDVIVVGKLDLRHRIVKWPLEFKNCWFLGTVDLRYCEFEQAVYFWNCTFYQAFNSGDSIESHSVYRKELIFNKSCFKKAASFNGVQVESSAYFCSTRFELRSPELESETVEEFPWLSKDYTVDFATAYFGCHIECDDAVFMGPASFNSISCDSNGILHGAYFEEEANFTAASFGRNLELAGAQFTRLANFNSVKCDGNGILRDACFEEEANFTAASFGRNLQCTGTQFKGSAILNSLKCDGAWIAKKAHFGDRVNLRYSSFALPLVCEESSFWGEVDCSGMECTHGGNFTKCRFVSDKAVVFSGAQFGGGLGFQSALFKGEVRFQGLRCDGTGNFRDATFIGSEVDFRYSYFGADLDLRGTYFARRVRLARVSTMNRLRLGASYFGGESELFASEIKILELIDANYPLSKHPLRARIMAGQVGFVEIIRDKVDLDLKLRKIPLEKVARKLGTSSVHQKERMLEGLFPFRPKTLNLTDIRFERFHGGPNRELSRELALRFAEGQDSTKFSRDPYLQLEKYYSSIGEEDDALRIHYKGRCAIRENAKAFKGKGQQGRVSWSGLKIWGPDFLWKWATGYGQRMHRLLLIFLFFVASGMVLFWPDNALTLPPSTDSLTQAQEKRLVQKEQMRPKALDRLVYSVDLLIPVLDLRGGDVRIPNDNRRTYEVIHIFAGWLLAALLLAWITTVAKGGR